LHKRQDDVFSFEKRSKNFHFFLSARSNSKTRNASRTGDVKNKSFLVLFFKKEHSSFLDGTNAHLARLFRSG